MDALKALLLLEMLSKKGGSSKPPKTVYKLEMDGGTLQLLESDLTQISCEAVLVLYCLPFKELLDSDGDVALPPALRSVANSDMRESFENNIKKIDRSTMGSQTFLMDTGELKCKRLYFSVVKHPQDINNLIDLLQAMGDSKEM